MATKLKNLHLKKVDLVDEGANPGAHVTLFKRREPGRAEKSGENPAEGQEELLKRFCGFLVESGFDAVEITKQARTFQESMVAVDQEKAAEEIRYFVYSLSDSLASILFDDEIDPEEKKLDMEQSLDEFIVAAKACVDKWSSGKAAKIEKAKEALPAKGNGSIELFSTTEIMEGDSGEMKIDKSKMTPEERASFDELIRKYAAEGEGEDLIKAKAQKVDPAAGQEGAEDKVDVDGDDENDDAADGKKASAKKSLTGGIEKELKAELESLKKFRAEMELKQLETFAKKYEVLGKKPEEVAKTLKKAKDAGGTAYDDMVAMLDEMVSMQEATGVFAEVGKSGHAPVTAGGSAAVAKAREVAKKYIEADPRLTMEKALAKAWEDHPELMDAYEEEAGF